MSILDCDVKECKEIGNHAIGVKDIFSFNICNKHQYIVRDIIREALIELVTIRHDMTTRYLKKIQNLKP